MSLQLKAYEPVSEKLNAGYRHNSLKPLPVEFGGSGSNTGAVLTNSTTYTATMTLTANTAVTLPTSGTLVTTADLPSSQTKKTLSNAPVILDTSTTVVTTTGTVNQYVNSNIESYTLDLAWASGGASLDTTQYGGIRISLNITISSSNNTFYYNSSSFTITAQRYSATSLATAIQTGLTNDGVTGASVSYSTTTNKFTISSTSAISLPFASNTTNSIGSILGITTDHAAATSHLSDSAVVYLTTASNTDLHPGVIIGFTGITFTVPAAGTGKDSTQLGCSYSIQNNTITIYGPNSQGFAFAASGTIKLAFTVFRF